jgi:hypothetical protein
MFACKFVKNQKSKVACLPMHCIFNLEAATSKHVFKGKKKWLFDCIKTVVHKYK